MRCFQLTVRIVIQVAQWLIGLAAKLLSPENWRLTPGEQSVNHHPHIAIIIFTSQSTSSDWNHAHIAIVILTLHHHRQIEIIILTLQSSSSHCIIIVKMHHHPHIASIILTLQSSSTHCYRPPHIAIILLTLQSSSSHCTIILTLQASYSHCIIILTKLHHPPITIIILTFATNYENLKARRENPQKLTRSTHQHTVLPGVSETHPTDLA